MGTALFITLTLGYAVVFTVVTKCIFDIARE